MVDGLFLVGIAGAGFLPAATVFFRRRKLSLFACFGWLALGAAVLLRPGTNDPHPFGIVVFFLFLVGWIGAFALITSPAVRRLSK